MQNVNSETKCKNCGHRFGLHQASGEACPDTTDENPDPSVKMFRFRTDSKFEPEDFEKPKSDPRPNSNSICKHCGFVFEAHRSFDSACPSGIKSMDMGIGYNAMDDYYSIQYEFKSGFVFEPVVEIKFGREGLRKVNFSRYPSNEERKQLQEKGMKLPWKIFHVEGYFHAWGTSYEELDKGTGNFTTAIVEDESGQVFEVIPSDVKFIS